MTAQQKSTGVVSKQAAKLAEGIAQNMLMTHLKIVTTAVLALLLVATGVGAVAGRLVANGPSVVSLSESPTGQAAPKEEFNRQIRSAVAKAVDYFKSAQRNGNWEGADKTNALWKGGQTSLAMLALLTSGVKPDDPIIKRGLAYLRQIKPNITYVVALQTMVFAELGQNVDRQRIQNNVNWLIEAMVVENGRCKGWTYTKGKGQLSDNSNTQYAVMALHAASRAGTKIPDQQQVWKKIQGYYLSTQKADGGLGLQSSLRQHHFDAQHELRRHLRPGHHARAAERENRGTRRRSCQSRSFCGRAFHPGGAVQPILPASHHHPGRAADPEGNVSW
jgi:hypothetical protein